jgi:Uncharacterized protein conserved in bacteria (DUF2332)/SnoaL-like domain
LFAAVQYLLLQSDPHPLGRFYPSLGAERAWGDPWPVFRDFALSRRAELKPLIARRHTQTNEVRRSAVLYPALALAARELGEPVAVLEAGAAAGLNLLFDRYWFDYGAAGTAGDPASPVRARCQVVLRGKDGVRQAFTKLLGEVPQATWNLKTTIYEDDILFLEWDAEGGGNRIRDAVDTFVFRDGLIRVQTVRYTLQPAR